MNGSFVRPKIRVMVIDDSAFMRTALSRMIAAEPDFEVVATASNGADALQKIATLVPDVVTLDVNMPVLDGIGTLRRIMAQFPLPVIMVSSATAEDAEITFDALAAGAFDCLAKQLSSTSLEIEHIRGELILKLRAAALSRKKSAPPQPPRKPPVSADRARAKSASVEPAIVAIGASTGGPRALQEILPRFPHDFSLPILIVQHMPSGFLAHFARRLGASCSIAVKEASDGDLIVPGVAYIAPAGLHMLVEHRPAESPERISLCKNPSQVPHIPSVDVLMTSVARVYGSRAVGVILTGMGTDGAKGMRAIHDAGGLTIGQDQATCTVYGMPRACAEAGVLSRVLALAEVPAHIVQISRSRRLA
jgi:two-component system chemotaxis response regulator CheB